MKNKLFFYFLGICLITIFGFKVSNGEPKVYKYMIQMSNYTGEGAYVIVSLLDKENTYIETLYVQGDDDEWYSEITDWWQFQGKVRKDIDAVTGATVGAGQRAVNSIKIPSDLFGKGYKVRFETAVEDKAYFKDDIEIELTSVANIKGKIEGKGYIRYVRMIPQL